MHALIHIGTPLLQVIQAAPDTPFQKMASIASAVMALALLLLALGALLAMWNLRSASKRVNEMIDRVYSEVFPFVRSASVVTDDVREIIAAAKGEVQQVRYVVDTVNTRVLKVTQQAEARLDQFNTLLEMIQDEMEGAFVSTAATVRGVRTGLEQVFVHNEEKDDDDNDDGQAPNASQAQPRVRPKRSTSGIT